MKRFILYLYSILKNIIFLLALVLDIIGIVITYYTDFSIPQWIYYAIFMIGFIYSNYKVYIDNAPQLNMASSLLREYPFKTKGGCTESSCSLMANYNLYINNNSNNVGIIEDIKVSFLGFCNIKDEYILKKIGISFDGYFISQEEIFSPLEFMKDKHATKFPIIIEPKQTVKSILILYVTIDEHTRQEYIDTLEWMDDFQLEIVANAKNDSIQRKIIHKISISQKQICEYIKEEERLNIELEKEFQRMQAQEDDIS